MVDAVIWDLSMVVTQSPRKVAYSYFTKAGASYVNGLQEAETVIPLNYAKTVIDAVIQAVLIPWQIIKLYKVTHLLLHNEKI